MSYLTIAGYEVIPSRNAKMSVGIAGESLQRGQAIYKDKVSNKYQRCSASAVATSTIAGISLTTSATNQPVVFQTSGDLAFGNILETGLPYAIGDVGRIAPIDHVYREGFWDAVINTTTFQTDALIGDFVPALVLVGASIAIYDVTNANAMSIRYITVYDKITGRVTVNAAPDFTVAGDDLFRVWQPPVIGGTGLYTSIVGIATSQSNLRLSFNSSGVPER